MPIKINVPFSHKDEAKRLGAIWVPDAKTWVIPDNIENIDLFDTWLPGDGFIVKYPYLIAKSSRKCWKCQKETPLIALAAKTYFTNIFASEINLKWQKIEYPAFFIGIRFIDPALSPLLKEHYPFYQEMPSKKTGIPTWVNTCQYCQTIQGDDYNTDHSGSPFGGFLNEKKTLFRGKKMEQIQLRFDYYIDGVMYEGDYSWDGFSEAE
jgi:hypothetical protein